MTSQTQTAERSYRVAVVRRQIAALTPKAETGEQHAELCSLYAELEKLGAL